MQTQARLFHGSNFANGQLTMKIGPLENFLLCSIRFYHFSRIGRDGCAKEGGMEARKGAL